MLHVRLHGILISDIAECVLKPLYSVQKHKKTAIGTVKSQYIW